MSTCDHTWIRGRPHVHVSSRQVKEVSLCRRCLTAGIRRWPATNDQVSVAAQHAKELYKAHLAQRARQQAAREAA